MQVYLFIFSSRIFRPKFALPEFYIQEEVADRDKPLHHSQFLQKQRLRVWLGRPDSNLQILGIGQRFLQAVPRCFPCHVVLLINNLSETQQFAVVTGLEVSEFTKLL